MSFKRFEWLRVWRGNLRFACTYWRMYLLRTHFTQICLANKFWLQTFALCYPYIKAHFTGNQVCLTILMGLEKTKKELTEKSTSVSLDLLYFQLLCNFRFFLWYFLNLSWSLMWLLIWFRNCMERKQKCRWRKINFLSFLVRKLQIMDVKDPLMTWINFLFSDFL